MNLTLPPNLLVLIELAKRARGLQDDPAAPSEAGADKAIAKIYADIGEILVDTILHAAKAGKPADSIGLADPSRDDGDATFLPESTMTATADRPHGWTDTVEIDVSKPFFTDEDELADKTLFPESADDDAG